MNCYNGFNIVETNAVTKEVQRRTHKKRRINKKWLKRYGYKKVPDDTKVIVFGNNILVTPRMANRIIREVKQNEQSRAGTIR